MYFKHLKHFIFYGIKFQKYVYHFYLYVQCTYINFLLPLIKMSIICRARKLNNKKRSTFALKMFIEIFLSVVMDATMQNMKKLPVRSACMKIPKA